MSKPTIATVKAHARRLGMDIDYHEAGAYTVLNIDCPQGSRIEEGLHHFHAEWHTADTGWRAAEIADICQRLAGLQSLETCDDPDCDFCSEVPR